MREIVQLRLTVKALELTSNHVKMMPIVLQIAAFNHNVVSRRATVST